MPGALFAIPPRVRRSILDLLSGWGARPAAVIAELGQRRGFSTLPDLLGYIDDVYGREARVRVANTVTRSVRESSSAERLSSAVSRSVQLTDVATAALVAIPDDAFLFAGELGCELAARGGADLSGGIDQTFYEFGHRVTELFTANGIPYELDEQGQFLPRGSLTVSVAAVEPAMDVLDDARLAIARVHLIEAQRRLREPDPEEAVDEARQAVEAAMLGVLDAHNIPRPHTRTPDQLYKALTLPYPSAPPAMSRDAIELVLASPRFRGRTAAGHAGGAQVSLKEAEAAVAAAAASILYLADKFP